MSYARSPRPSLVITVGMRCTGLPPVAQKADRFFGRRWRVGHRQKGAEVGDAAQPLEGARGGREAQPEGRVMGPLPPVGVGAEQPGEVGVDLGRWDAEG